MKGIIFLILLTGILGLCGCNTLSDFDGQSKTYRDQEGHVVNVPRRITRLSGEGGIIYALGQQEKLVDQGIYYRVEAAAMARTDPRFAARPSILGGKNVNCETLAALKPQIVFANAMFHKGEKEQIERAGLKVFATKGETFDQSFETVRLIGQILGCEDRARAYRDDCLRLMKMVEVRTQDIPKDKRLRVMFAGPKSVYTVATGEMLQTEILRRAGADNVAQGLKGFWCDVSPEQVAAWNPDVIFLGSSMGTYDVDQVYRNSQFMTVTAVRQRRVYAFPSNVGWWDCPAPHCVLGVVWAAKTLYPERFMDIDMLKIADDFYAKYRGRTFTAMGGRL